MPLPKPPVWSVNRKRLDKIEIKKLNASEVEKRPTLPTTQRDRAYNIIASAKRPVLFKRPKFGEKPVVVFFCVLGQSSHYNARILSDWMREKGLQGKFEVKYFALFESALQAAPESVTKERFGKFYQSAHVAVPAKWERTHSISDRQVRGLYNRIEKLLST
ncbi:MAG: hypothetical protein QGI60_01320 [archaeon]|jgi:hypothetical protein|nr:hypothetical protein [archaeon]